MEYQERVSELFDAVAATYDSVGVEFFKPIASGLVEALDPRPGDRTVDIGCGRGAVLFRLASAVGPTGSVTGLDLSPRMVGATALDVTHSGLDIDVRVGDGMAPGLPLEAFDVVASSLVLFFLPDPMAALRAWRGLLVESGRVGVSTFGPYDHRWGNTVDPVLRAHAPAEVIDARSTGRQGPFGSDEGMEKLLVDAGFRQVRTVSSVVAPRFDDCEQWYDWSMSVGQRQFWETVPDERLDEVKAAVFAAVSECRDAEGRIGFDQHVRYTLGVR